MHLILTVAVVSSDVLLHLWECDCSSHTNRWVIVWKFEVKLGYRFECRYTLNTFKTFIDGKTVVNFSVIHLSSWSFKIYPLWSSRCVYLCCFLEVPIFLLIICSITCTPEHNMCNIWTQWCIANARIWFSVFILIFLRFTSDLMSQVVQFLLRHTSYFNEKVLALLLSVIMRPYSAPSLMFQFLL